MKKVYWPFGYFLVKDSPSARAIVIDLEENYVSGHIVTISIHASYSLNLEKLKVGSEVKIAMED